jgi:hypothetical protein
MKKVLILLVCGVLLVGCKSAVVTPEGTEAEFNKAERHLRAVLPATLPEVANATTETLTDLDLVAIDSTVDRLKGRITARMAVGTKVGINLEAVDMENTEIVIKVGTFGDRSISLQILRNIEKRLAE